jgi:hypothetical protein
VNESGEAIQIGTERGNGRVSDRLKNSIIHRHRLARKFIHGRDNMMRWMARQNGTYTVHRDEVTLIEDEKLLVGTTKLCMITVRWIFDFVR